MRNFLSWSFPTSLVASVLLTTAGIAVGQGDVLEGWRIERKGSLTVYAPPDLKSGEAFALVTEPPVNLERENLGEWVAARGEKEAAKLGTVVSRTKPVLSSRNGTEIATCSFQYRPKSGTGMLLVAYTVARRADGTGTVARMVSTPQKETYRRYIPAATDAILTLASRAESTSRVASGSRPSSSSPRSGSSTKRRPSRTDAYTRAGAGPKASAIFGVYSNMVMQTGVGGAFYMVHEPMILLKDGTYYEDFDVPLADFDVAAARAARPKAWGKWRRQGAAFHILTGKGVWKTEKFYGPLPRGKPGEKLSGFYSTISGGGDTAFGGTTMVVATNDITFLPNGQFKSGRFGGAMTPNVTARSESRDGGTYTLDGYTLTMKYTDGRIERKAFAYMDTDGTKDAFYLNGSPYLKKTK